MATTTQTAQAAPVVAQPGQAAPGSNPVPPAGGQAGAPGANAGGGQGGNVGGGGGPGPPGGPGPGGAAAAFPQVPQVPFAFALSPARVSDLLLDYTRTADVKQYYKSVSPLDPKFDLSPGGMLGFLQAFRDRARESNWYLTLCFIMNGIMVNLVNQYGTVTIDNVRAHVLTYQGMMSRNAQNSNQIYVCLSLSLTDEAKHKVSLDAGRYTIGDECDGLLFFKVIVGLAHVDTRATVTVIRTRLSSLDTKMSDVQDNIVELNQFVKAQQDGLTARGERTDDLLVNLFKAYRACGDHEFLTWIRAKEDSYNEGANFTPEMLMSLADNKYTTLVDSGLWMQKSEAQKRIVALAAQVQTLEKGKQAVAKAKKDKDKKDYKGKKDKNKKDKKFDKHKEPAWVTVAPGAGQPQDKTVEEKEWHWCIHHGDAGKWVRHTRAECKIKKELDAKTAKAAGGNSQMKVAAMVAVYPEDDDF